MRERASERGRKRANESVRGEMGGGARERERVRKGEGGEVGGRGRGSGQVAGDGGGRGSMNAAEAPKPKARRDGGGRPDGARLWTVNIRSREAIEVVHNSP